MLLRKETEKNDLEHIENLTFLIRKMFKVKLTKQHFSHVWKSFFFSFLNSSEIFKFF